MKAGEKINESLINESQSARTIERENGKYYHIKSNYTHKNMNDKLYDYNSANKDDIITKIHHNCPPCKTKDCENYCGEGDMILEVQGGTCKKLGIKSGDTIVHYD